MKNISGQFIFTLCLLAAVLPGRLADDLPAPSIDGEANSLLLKFTSHWDKSQAQTYFAGQQLRPIDYLPQIDVWRVAPEQKMASEMLVPLQHAVEVEWIELNQTVRATDVIPNDNFFSFQQENLRVIGLPAAWEYSTGTDLPIAIIDSGVDLDHPDLKNKLWRNPGEIAGNLLDDDQNGLIDDLYGWDYVNGDAIPQDDFSHGSHVAGIAAAETNNAVGIAGVSWGARIMALKALNQIGEGSWFDVAAAILYAADKNARIINMSFGSLDSSQAIEAAVQYAVNKDCLLIASAGNGGGAVLYPAALPQVMAIAATDNQDLPWSFSNRGAEVELSAPGVHILSANSSGSYSFMDGTSMAAPHASGVAALLWSVRPGTSAEQIRRLLISSAKDVWSPGWDSLTGWGRLDAYRALKTISPAEVYLPVLVSRYSSMHWNYLPFVLSGPQ